MLIKYNRDYMPQMMEGSQSNIIFLSVFRLIRYTYSHATQLDIGDIRYDTMCTVDTFCNPLSTIGHESIHKFTVHVGCHMSLTLSHAVSVSLRTIIDNFERFRDASSCFCGSHLCVEGEYIGDAIAWLGDIDSNWVTSNHVKCRNSR